MNNWKCQTLRTFDNFQTYEHEYNYDNFTIKFTEKNHNVLSSTCEPKTKESQETLQKVLEHYKKEYA